MTIDEAIAHERELAKRNRILLDSDELVQKSYDAYFDKLKCKKCAEEHEQLAEWLVKLKTIENIMLIYNANWYADEDNGVPDSEVLESIWNVIQDNGLDIDIEQDYRKGKVDGYNKAIDDFADKAIKVVFEANNRDRNPKPRDMVADIHYKLLEVAEQLKAGGRE